MDMLNDFLEKTLEDIIYDNKEVIHERGLPRMKSNSFRQTVLPSGKRIDILGFGIESGVLYCDIYELKRKTINADAICQAFDYYTELKSITKDYFSGFFCKIVMIGREYIPTSIINSLPIKIEVYMYQYPMSGIQFKEIQDYCVSYTPHESFSYGLWAFGKHGVGYAEKVSSISFHSAYKDYTKENPDFNSKLKKMIDLYVNTDEAEIIEESIEKINYESKKLPSEIKTEIFPEQPQWSREFLNCIPDATSIMEDIEIDLCDFEDDELEIDSDFEPDSDYEPEGEDAWHSSEPQYDKQVYINSLKLENIDPIENNRSDYS